MNFFSHNTFINGNTSGLGQNIVSLPTIEYIYNIYKFNILIDIYTTTAHNTSLFGLDYVYFRIIECETKEELINLHKSHNLKFKYSIKEEKINNNYSVVTFNNNEQVLIINDSFDNIINNDNYIFDEKLIKQYNNICSFYPIAVKRKLTAINRYAMILSGKILSYEYNFLHQLNNFYKNNKNEYIDIYVSINDKLNDKNKLYYTIFYDNIYPTKLYINKYILPDKFNININTYLIQYIRLEHINNLSSYKNFLSGFYNLHKCCNLIKSNKEYNNINYINIINYRADIISDNFPIFNIPLDKNNIISTDHYILEKN